MALQVCALLEGQGVPCWIAPRDVAPGAKWDEAIVDAITAAGAFLLILTAGANESPYVGNEVNHAFAAKKPIFTFRVEDVQPSKSLGFYLARHHWTDGFPAPIDQKLAQLAAAVTALLPATVGAAAANVATGNATKAVVPLAKKRSRWRRGVRVVSSSWAGARASLVVAALAGAAVALGASRFLAPSPEPSPFMHVEIAPTPGQRTGLTSALSPDGRWLAYEAQEGDGPFRLWVRALDSVDAKVVPGTDAARAPFWSPDGGALGFFAGGKLRVVHLDTGRVQVIGDAVGERTAGSWSQHGVILFATEREMPIMRVDAEGRTPPVPATAGPGFRPYFLPDGRHFLFGRPRDGGAPDGIGVGVLDSLEGTVLRPDGSEPKYAAGHLRRQRQRAD